MLVQEEPKQLKTSVNSRYIQNIVRFAKKKCMLFNICSEGTYE